MSSITQSLATQSAIMRANSAEMDVIRANQAQQSLIGSKGNIEDIARKETQLQLAKEQAALKAKIARAEKEALKNKNKLHYFA